MIRPRLLAIPALLLLTSCAALWKQNDFLAETRGQQIVGLCDANSRLQNRVQIASGPNGSSFIVQAHSYQDPYWSGPVILPLFPISERPRIFRVTVLYTDAQAPYSEGEFKKWKLSASGKSRTPAELSIRLEKGAGYPGIPYDRAVTLSFPIDDDLRDGFVLSADSAPGSNRPFELQFMKNTGWNYIPIFPVHASSCAKK